MSELPWELPWRALPSEGVHLVWHGRIDMMPDQFPDTTFYSSGEEFLAQMRHDAEERRP